MPSWFSMQSAGILLGLAAALSQACSYLYSRHFVSGRAGAPLRLLLASHVLMGAACLLPIPLLWAAETPPWQTWIGPLVACTGFFLAGQSLFFVLIRRLPASRVSPLLGLKIVLLALLSPWFAEEALGTGQWTAVAMATAATFLLGSLGGRLSASAAVCLLGVCLFYSLSDIHIARFVRALAPMPLVRAVPFATCLSYGLAGVVLSAAAPFLQRGTLVRDLRPALPFAAFWLLSMFLLYGSFAIVGPLFGNVLQSTRGIIAVGLGILVAHLGHHGIEMPASRAQWTRRALAAVFMTAAVALYSFASVRPS